MKYRIGLDIGSTTAKVVLLDDSGRKIWSEYKRHNTHVNDLLREYVGELRPIIGGEEFSLCVTGSVGMAVSEQLGVPFVQEVIAASVFVKYKYPNVKTLIDIGGEDSKIISLHDNRSDLRMNGNCAGGTGAFIDQMSKLLGVSNDELSQLAERSTSVQPMAARCGVFAKTDVQNLISRNIPQEDIAASIFHAIAVQTMTALAHGMTFDFPILLCGGPLSFMPSLRKAFADYLHCKNEELLIDDDSKLIPAYGCALSVKEDDARLTLDFMDQQLEKASSLNKVRTVLPKLFANTEDYTSWVRTKNSLNVEVQPMKANEDVYLGIDSGSTTTKVIAVRKSGEVVFSHYVSSNGHPIETVRDSLKLMQQEAEKQGAKLYILASCSTGYGEELIKTAFNLDFGIIETLAHYRAAVRMNPDVSFILDIGGQDMKAIWVDKGIVTRVEINEACSSGCGSFIQTFAESLGYKVQEFASMACMAENPCDLGSRCTVFMNSKVKQVLREGASTSDISAGLAYSVVNNCLYKVLKLRDKSDLGVNIVVQGGTMRNDAIVRALEILTGCSVQRSSMPEMMGAYGCALYSADQAYDVKRPLEQFIVSADSFTTDKLHCHGCENRCCVTRYHFGDRKYYSGNKCETVFSNSTTKEGKGQNIYRIKNQLLFDRDCQTAKTGMRIGVPRCLNMFENYPFWHALLTTVGFQVVLSEPSQMSGYEQSVCTVMSDNICFPAKLAHSHIHNLQQQGVNRILMPYVVYEAKESPTSTNSYNCPIVSGYSDVIRSSMSPDVPIDSPVINFGDKSLLTKQLEHYLSSLGVAKNLINKAIETAIAEQTKYEAAIAGQAEMLFAEAKAKNMLTIVLAGRPYHTDPLIQHKLGDILTGLGVQVISEDIVRHHDDWSDGKTNSVRQWTYVNRIIKAANWVASQTDDIQFVELTSFGCGPDAFIQDEVRDILSRHGKSLTLLKIDDVTNVGSLKLRVRSLIESIRYKKLEQGGKMMEKKFKTTKVFDASDSKRTILIPFISEYISPLLPSLGGLAGYSFDALPPSDAESAKIGLKYSNNEVCYPATLIVGDIIKALQSGKYNLNNVAVGMTQTGGQCRATNYAGMIKRAMVQAGLSNVPVVTLGVTTSGTENEQYGFDFPWAKMIHGVLSTILFADCLAKMFHAAVVRENRKGVAEEIRDKYLSLAETALRTNHVSEMKKLLVSAAACFNECTIDKNLPRVGVVGEIFLKLNHFAHQNVVEQIMREGLEVEPPLIIDFFMQEFVNMKENRILGLTSSHFPMFIVDLLKKMVDRQIHNFNKACSGFRYYKPFTDIKKLSEKITGIVSPAAQFGEGWLIPAEVAEFCESGVSNVISLQPFGCIANQIIAKGVENAIRKRYPDLNLLTLDFDSGVSEVNVTNRLQLFLTTAKQKAEES